MQNVRKSGMYVSPLTLLPASVCLSASRAVLLCQRLASSAAAEGGGSGGGAAAARTSVETDTHHHQDSGDNGGSGESSNFGFKRVPREKKAGLVGGVFSRVSGYYDLMNDLMSAGLHRTWKDTYVKQMPTLTVYMYIYIHECRQPCIHMWMYIKYLYIYIYTIRYGRDCRFLDAER